MLKPNIEDSTSLRVQQLTGKPLTKGFDKHINALCDEVEDLRNEVNGTPQVKKLDCMCPESKEALEQVA